VPAQLVDATPSLKTLNAEYPGGVAPFASARCISFVTGTPSAVLGFIPTITSAGSDRGSRSGWYRPFFGSGFSTEILGYINGIAVIVGLSQENNFGSRTLFARIRVLKRPILVKAE
jgi:hypothetical protein